MQNNKYEKYNQLHNEIINRLENGEIATEQAKKVIDLAFDKYITEAVSKNTKSTNYDKVAWHIDVGADEAAVVEKFKKVFKFLNDKKLLSSDGTEIYKSSIDNSAALTSVMLTTEGNEFMKKYYDKVIIKLSASEIDKTLEQLYKLFSVN